MQVALKIVIVSWNEKSRWRTPRRLYGPLLLESNEIQKKYYRDESALICHEGYGSAYIDVFHAGGSSAVIRRSNMTV